MISIVFSFAYLRKVLNGINIKSMENKQTEILLLTRRGFYSDLCKKETYIFKDLISELKIYGRFINHNNTRPV